LVCPLEGALQDAALLYIFMECWSNGVLENEDPTPLFYNFIQRPSRFSDA
jgi:hypothetical protein